MKDFRTFRRTNKFYVQQLIDGEWVDQKVENQTTHDYFTNAGAAMQFARSMQENLDESRKNGDDIIVIED